MKAWRVVCRSAGLLSVLLISAGSWAETAYQPVQQTRDAQAVEVYTTRRGEYPEILVQGVCSVGYISPSSLQGGVLTPPDNVEVSSLSDSSRQGISAITGVDEARDAVAELWFTLVPGESVIDIAERYQSDSKQRQIDALIRESERQITQTRILWLVLGSSFIILLGSQLFLLRLRRSYRLLEISNRELSAARSEQKAILDAIPDLMFELDLSGRYCACYVFNSELLQTSPEELQGKAVKDVMDEESSSICLAALQEANDKGISIGAQIQFRYGRRKKRWFELSIAKKIVESDSEPRFVVLSRDITERKIQQLQEESRLQILECLAEGGELSEVLDLIVKSVEQEVPDLLVSIMLLDESGQHLITAAAPSLPSDFSDSVNGLKVGEGEGSCGTAVWRGEAVFAEDTRTHPYWEPYKNLALDAGLLACWSEPIYGSSGQVLGVFGLYRREPGLPEEEDKGCVYRATHLAAIAIERMHMEKALRDSEREFRMLAENAPVNIARHDVDCRLVYANRKMLASINYPAVKALGKTPNELSCCNSSAVYQTQLGNVIATGHPCDVEITMLSPDGRGTMHHHILLVPERDAGGMIIGVLAIGSDVSNQKRAEEHLKNSQAELRSLAARLETAQEEERRRIACELHDEMGQLLTAIRMEISILKLRYSLDDPQFQHKVQNIVELVDKTIRGVRDVVVMLRPAALERGIIEALEWLVNEFSHRTGIACELNISSRLINLNEEHSIALFRITQESLTNVARHANADNVTVSLECHHSTYRLEIADNGKGFDPTLQKSRSAGLVGIRERVLRLKGKIQINTALGEGTRLEICIPFHKIETANTDN